MVKVNPKHFPSQTHCDVVNVARMVSGGPELASRAVHDGTERASARYPCLTGNNSINVDAQDVKWLKELKKEEEKIWKEKINPLLNSYHRKASKILEERIKFMCEKNGKNSMAVLHLGFEDDPDYQTAQDRMNSLRTNVFGKRYRDSEGLLNFVTICERGGKNGKLHFHVLVSNVEKDFHTGSYRTFNKNTKKKEFHPNRDCRHEWDHFRSVLKKYNFGDYVLFEPLWSVKGGAKYFSKYVGKGHYTRDESMVGKQLIRFGSGFRQQLRTISIPTTMKSVVGLGRYVPSGFVKFTAQQQVNWFGGVATGRRRVLGEVIHATGAGDVESLNKRFGPRWQHLCKDQMLVASALSDVRMSEKTKDILYYYALNRWKITIQFQEDGNQVIMGRDASHVYTLRELFEYALNHLMDRMEEVEHFQYEDHNTREMVGPVATTLHRPLPVIDPQGKFPF